LNITFRRIPTKTAMFAMICHLFFCILWFLLLRFCECIYVTSDFGFTRTKFQFFNYFFKHTIICFTLVYTGVFSEIMCIFWHLVYRTKQEYENRKKLGYVKGANIKNPSVVSLNGMIASFAINQFIKIITHIGKTATLTIYDFLDSSSPSVVPQHVKIDEKCIHKSFKGIEDGIHLERFVKKEETAC